MTTLSPLDSSNFTFLLLTSILLFSGSLALEFRVGGPRGWTEPTGNEAESYNHWARRNRFHIGDTIYYKYEDDDSVLVVNREDYGWCNTSSPLAKFTDRNTTFRFDRFGYFYFISGIAEHCRAGQKLIVRVTVHQEVDAVSPGPPPFPPQQGGEWSPDAGLGRGHPGLETSNGVLKAIVGSSVVIAGVVSLFVVFIFA